MREGSGRDRDPARRACRTVRDIHAAERELQSASLVAERRRILGALEAGLRSLHASRVAAVVARFADQRRALVHVSDPLERAAASSRIAIEEAHELARLAIEHAAEKRGARRQATVTLAGRHRDARKRLHRGQRSQRAVMAVHLRSLQAPTGAVDTGGRKRFDIRLRPQQRQ